MSWIVFFPLTLWRIIRHPLASMAYAEAELARPEDDQYGATVTPPIFLTLALLLAHAVELALYGTNPIIASRHGLAALVTDNSSLLLLRLILFGTFPVIMATLLVRRRGVHFERRTLKAPFYAQCYAVAPFALGVSLGGSLFHSTFGLQLAGGVAMVASLLFYGLVQSLWFARELGQPRWRGFLNASLGMVQAILVAIVMALLFAL